MSRFLGPSMAFVLAAQFVGCGASSTSVKVDVVVPPADIVVPAEELGIGFGLANKYPDKTVETAGKIDSIKFDTPKSSVVVLKTGPGIASILGCLIQEPNVWARFGPGQSITLHGKKISGGIRPLFGWKIVKSGPNPCPILTSQQWSEELEQNFQEAKAKYFKHSFYLTGKIAKVEETEWKSSIVSLENSAGWAVRLALDTDSAALVKPIKAGQTMAALCTLSSLLHFDNVAKIVEVEAIAIAGKFPVAGVTYASTLPSAAEIDAQAASAMREASPDFQLSSADFQNEFKLNSSDFIQKYSGKILDVTGVVRGFRNWNGRDVVILVGRSEQHELSCQLRDRCPWDEFVPGQIITVRGKLRELVLTPDLEGAVIVKSDPSPPIRELTAAELFKIVHDSGDDFDQDWKGQWVKVTGPLISAKIEPYLSNVNLDGGDEQIVCVILETPDYAERIEFANRPAGQKVRLLGRLSQLHDNELSLRDGWILADDKPAK